MQVQVCLQLPAMQVLWAAPPARSPTNTREPNHDDLFVIFGASYHDAAANGASSGPRASPKQTSLEELFAGAHRRQHVALRKRSARVDGQHRAAAGPLEHRHAGLAAQLERREATAGPAPTDDQVLEDDALTEADLVAGRADASIAPASVSPGYTKGRPAVPISSAAVEAAWMSPFSILRASWLPLMKPITAPCSSTMNVARRSAPRVALRIVSRSALGGSASPRRAGLSERSADTVTKSGAHADGRARAPGLVGLVGLAYARMTVIFCHGLESTPHGRKYQALVAAGLDVVSPDFRHQDLAARVATLAPVLRAATDPVLVGSSYGGITALCAAIRFVAAGGALRGLVLCAPALGRSEPPADGMRLHAPAPTIIIHGTRDEVVPSAVSQGFAAAHPEVQLVLVDDEHRLVDSIDVIVAATRALVLGQPFTP